jgi:hypothetical protein
VGQSGIGLAERNVRAQGASLSPSSPAIVLRGTFGGTNPLEGLLVWTARGALWSARVSSMDIDLAGYQYCTSNRNSTGERGWMRAVGQPNPQAAVLRLEAYDLPTNAFGYFLCSLGSGFVPYVGGSQGDLCLSGNRFGRFAAQIGQTNQSGRLTVLADPRALPQSNGTTAALAGEHWCFQCWHRDVNHGGATSNLTNAVRVIFE